MKSLREWERGKDWEMSPDALQYKRWGKETDLAKKPEKKQLVREEENQESVVYYWEAKGSISSKRKHLILSMPLMMNTKNWLVNNVEIAVRRKLNKSCFNEMTETKAWLEYV